MIEKMKRMDSQSCEVYQPEGQGWSRFWIGPLQDIIQCAGLVRAE